jgi:hypothetical protein
MPSQLMYDSTTPAAIPANAKLILTYIDGNYVTDHDVAIRFPTATRITTTTTTNGNLSARIYDCERGDGNATEAAAWAKEKLTLNQRPTIYCSRVGEPNYGWSWVQSALELIKVPISAVDFGIADYTGVQHLVPGSAFTQYVDPPNSGGDYDISVTNGVWPDAPEPPITTAGTYITENGMIVVTESTVDGNRHVFVYDETDKSVTHWYQSMKGGGPNGFNWVREVLPSGAA